MDADLKHFNPTPTSTGTGAGGLTRYNSAPSSFFSNFVMEYRDVSEFLRPQPPKPISPQIDRIFAQLASEAAQVATKLEIEPAQSLGVDVVMPTYTPTSALPPPHPLSRTSSGVERGAKSSAPPQVRGPAVDKKSSGLGLNLARHNSLPHGIFSHIDVHDVAAAYSGGGNNQANSSSELMSAFSGIGNDDGKQSSDFVLNDYMIEGFWNDSSSSITGVKRERIDDEAKPFSAESNIRAEEMKKSGLLSHHLSLPKSSMEILSAMEKFLELQDSTVPVGVRAKRGCATHPRSIAERVYTLYSSTHFIETKTFSI